MEIDLGTLKTDKIALIKEIKGGHGIVLRLQCMGIRVGKTIKKVSGHSLRGPQIVKIDNMQLAIGLGMAKHILVEVKE